MVIKFIRNEKGELIAIDAETKKEIGKMTTMGDEVKEENENKPK